MIGPSPPLPCLDSRIPGHGAELAPVLGHGITEDRDHVPPISNPHGMSIEWGRIPTGGSIGRHLLREKQVMIVFSGAVENHAERRGMTN
jgi:hypothetical protein